MVRSASAVLEWFFGVSTSCMGRWDLSVTPTASTCLLDKYDVLAGFGNYPLSYLTDSDLPK